MQNTKIDFVQTWVDGSDPAWIAEKRKYENTKDSISSSDIDATADCRYRDCGLLKYWFRAVERFAPWVNRVFFVTCGQKPGWLNEQNPKLRLVNHKEYIPVEYLPTFNSNTIELNLHRIPDLSEQFVLFNDDVFFLKPVKPEFFFKKGLPVIPCDLGVPRWLGYNNASRVVINNHGVLKRSMDVERLAWKQLWKFSDVSSLGVVRAVKNVAALAVNRTVIEGTFGHLSLSHLKSTFDEIWHAQPDIMDKTSRNRFRCDDGVNHWLASAWNMIQGRFYPANEKKNGFQYMVNDRNLARICDTIRHQTLPQICLTDKGSADELDRCFKQISLVFDKLLPEKSSFEK